MLSRAPSASKRWRERATNGLGLELTPMIMQRDKVDHVLRAAASVTGHKTFVLIGSAALIARIKGPTPASMLMTQEVDIYAFDVGNADELSDMIDGSIGQNSPFHTSFGFYADGVSSETAKMPLDWMTRASKYSSPGCPGVTAIVPEENDLALAKAGGLAREGHRLAANGRRTSDSSARPNGSKA